MQQQMNIHPLKPLQPLQSQNEAVKTHPEIVL